MAADAEGKEQGGMRLLVIEDEPRMRELIAGGLERAGFVVDTVPTLGDAEATLRATPYDAAVLDLGLPDGDGLALLETLRQRPKRPPVLVLTARDSVEDRVNGLDAGADDYLVKPFAMAELVARLKALLRPPAGPRRPARGWQPLARHHRPRCSRRRACASLAAAGARHS
ncbi:response regulator transcription factor [Phenylobacterium sp. J367]|uniref:response regulator transcription factor n=1 Tax=Phenylobacterium sp. J367 TaxID=2898435 RepID=UPI0021517246|nr:response regulator [Phenylobacterium sp. J367]MCR5881308.1 response regulator [Phenylobacterium sp. J367]